MRLAASTGRQYNLRLDSLAGPLRNTNCARIRAMTRLEQELTIPGVSEAEIVSAEDAETGGLPNMLFEVPHGATRERHYDAVRRRLSGEMPEDLKAFFFVNTDVGSIECARRAAQLLTQRPLAQGLSSLFGPQRVARVERIPRPTILLLRCLVPRTFIDCNRDLAVAPESARAAGLTGAVPEYVTGEDLQTLREMHTAYTNAARHAYASICGRGDSAVIFHTYAPKSVDITRIDTGIVRALREAYSPERYAAWPARPDVDIISEAADRSPLAPRGLVESIRRYYAKVGIEATENASYRLHPATLGYQHSAEYPGQVLCIEISRGRLADPFMPFEEMTIGADNVSRMVAPVAAALFEELSGQ
jgi:hypothetical protein